MSQMPCSNTAALNEHIATDPGDEDTSLWPEADAILAERFGNDPEMIEHYMLKFLNKTTISLIANYTMEGHNDIAGNEFARLVQMALRDYQIDHRAAVTAELRGES